MEPNNYLYYVIQDSEQNIRCNIIGTQHNVDQKDTKLNPVIIDAIKRSTRAILEMPPDSKLIPSSSSEWIPNPEWVIDREFKKIISQPGNPEEIDIIEEEVKVLLRDIKGQTLPKDYEKVIAVIEKIKSSEDKLNFVQAILANMSEFNRVSLEENINKIIQANEKCDISSLEDIDLADLLKKAKAKIEGKLEAAQQRAQQHIKRLKAQRDHVKRGSSGRAKKASLNIQIQIHEERLQELQGGKKNRKLEIRRQTVQKKLYRAWVKGDAEELKRRLKECFLLYPEAPEFEKIHAPRDANIAKCIVDVILRAKKEEESLVVVGDAHLLYSKRKNVLEYLNERFKSDLSGWSIKQVKNV